MMESEHLVGEARERRKHEMDVRERRVDRASAALFLAAAVAIALLVPNHHNASPEVVAGLVIGYAIVSRVRFEFGDMYVSPEALVFVPLLLLAPLNLVPLLAALGGLLATIPEYLRGDWHRERWITCISDSWFSVGPVLVLALWAPGEPSLEHAWVYAAALLALAVTTTGWALVRERLLDRSPMDEFLEIYVGGNRITAIMSLVAFFPTLVAVEQPLVLLSIGPLVWLLTIFSRDRTERYSATLELHRAYRGTVMLLVDVLEFDDNYTADHSRSVVELAQAVGEEMGLDLQGRQELEFAALLHDVGKIAIPKEIINKPAALTDTEFEVIKTHTIEGQFMLDRIGGVLGRVGEVVRSCHERWDGKGYPDGLNGEQIPLPARVVFACDAYNAMTTDRPYRAALSQADAIEELLKHSGTQFDPVVVAALVNVIEVGHQQMPLTDHVRALLAGAQVAEQHQATA